jgi:hypothetical protein
VNKGAKIAIGCGVAVVAIGIASVVAVLGLGYWAAGKAKQAVHEMAGDQKKMAELEQKANANPFTPPADGSLSEPRLVSFLEVRKRVYDVYLEHKPELDAIVAKNNNHERPSLDDITGSLALITAARQARLQGLADVGMSETEYMYYASAVYTSAVASEVSKATGGKKVSAAVKESMEKAARALDEAANATPDPNLPPEAQKMIREAQERARQQQAELTRQAEEAAEEGTRGVDVPDANIAIFQRHEAEIKKYAMNGLEFLGI